jgi:hypothetical protein
LVFPADQFILGDMKSRRRRRGAPPRQRIHTSRLCVVCRISFEAILEHAGPEGRPIERIVWEIVPVPTHAEQPALPRIGYTNGNGRPPEPDN